MSQHSMKKLLDSVTLLKTPAEAIGRIVRDTYVQTVNGEMFISFEDKSVLLVNLQCDHVDDNEGAMGAFSMGDIPFLVEIGALTEKQVEDAREEDRCSATTSDAQLSLWEDAEGVLRRQTSAAMSIAGSTHLPNSTKRKVLLEELAKLDD